jgi:hypothetical protein
MTAPMHASVIMTEQVQLASDSIASAPVPPSAPTPAQMAHLVAVRERLDARERAIAEAAIHRMTSEQLAHWLGELTALSVEDATRTIRDLIAQIRPTAGKS